MGRRRSEDLDSSVPNSTYRQTVLEHLAVSGDSTPQQIADQSAAKRPHVSRALTELQEKDAVELRVPERTHVGRYYGLTAAGEAAWGRLEDELRAFDWGFSSPDDRRSEAVAELARRELGDSLRFVGEHRDGTVSIYSGDEDALAEYADDEIEQAIRSYVCQPRLHAVSVPKGPLRSETRTYGPFVVLRIRVGASHHLAVSFDRDADIVYPRFAATLREPFE